MQNQKAATQPKQREPELGFYAKAEVEKKKQTVSRRAERWARYQSVLQPIRARIDTVGLSGR